MSRNCPVAVRILRQKDGTYLVVGRKTQVLCPDFESAWDTSVPYFAGRKW